MISELCSRPMRVAAALLLFVLTALASSPGVAAQSPCSAAIDPTACALLQLDTGVPCRWCDGYENCQSANFYVCSSAPALSCDQRNTSTDCQNVLLCVWCSEYQACYKGVCPTAAVADKAQSLATIGIIVGASLAAFVCCALIISCAVCCRRHKRERDAAEMVAIKNEANQEGVNVGMREEQECGYRAQAHPQQQQQIQMHDYLQRQPSAPVLAQQQQQQQQQPTIAELPNTTIPAQSALPPVIAVLPGAPAEALASAGMQREGEVKTAGATFAVVLPGATTTATINATMPISMQQHTLSQRPATPQPGHVNEHEHEDDSQPGLTALAPSPATLVVSVSPIVAQPPLQQSEALELRKAERPSANNLDERCMRSALECSE